MPKRYFVNQFAESSSEEPLSKNINHWVRKVADLQETIVRNFKAIPENCDGGLYVGIGGVAFALWYASSKPAFTPGKDLRQETGQRICAVALTTESKKNRHHRKRDEVGFLLGSSGIYVAGALLAASRNDVATIMSLTEKLIDMGNIAKDPKFLRHGSDELFVGRAGWLCGVLNMKLKLGVEIDSQLIEEIWLTTVDSGRKYAKHTKSPCPLMYAYHGTEYLGAAHGLSAILQMLLSFPDILKAHPNSAADIKAAVDYFLHLQDLSGNFPCAMDELGRENDLIHWCHGAPGAIYLLARAYQLYREDKYLAGCIRCGEVIWSKGLLKKGPGICHGIAGNGYAFLLLYRLTHDKKHLWRAEKFAEFMESEEFQSGARTPDTPYSLYEGLAGTLCFYVDLCDPDSSEFPLFPVIF